MKMALVADTKWLTGNMSMSMDLVRPSFNHRAKTKFSIINYLAE
jgi:hypothetical protein